MIEIGTEGDTIFYQVPGLVSRVLARKNGERESAVDNGPVPEEQTGQMARKQFLKEHALVKAILLGKVITSTGDRGSENAQSDAAPPIVFRVHQALNSKSCVAAICRGYLTDGDGAPALDQATSRQEATRLTYLVMWNPDLSADKLDDLKLDEFITWRYGVGNLARGRSDRALTPQSMDLIVISIGNAMLWAEHKKKLTGPPFQRRSAKRYRKLSERLKHRKLKRRSETRREDEKTDHDGEWKEPLKLSQIQRLVEFILTPKYDLAKPRNFADIGRALEIAPQNVGRYAKVFSDFPRPEQNGIYDLAKVKAFLEAHHLHPGHWDGKMTRIENDRQNRWLTAKYIQVLTYGGGRCYATRMLLKEEAMPAKRELLWRMETQKRGMGHGPKRNYILDMSGELIAVIDELHRFKPRSPWLFPSPFDPDLAVPNPEWRAASCSFFANYLEEAIEATGLEKEIGHSIWFHDFRHYFIVQAVSSMVAPWQVARWCCHSNEKMIEDVYCLNLHIDVRQMFGRKVHFA